MTPSNMSLEEGCEAGRCYLRWDEFPPDHGKAAALYRLHHIFGFVQLGWLRVDLHSQVRTDKTGDSIGLLTHLTGKQSVGVEHAVLKKVGDHMPDKQIVDNNKKMVRIRTILSSQMAEHKCKSYKIMK